MKIIRSKDLVFTPASHENPTAPGALKKVLFRAADLSDGRIQMINWAIIPSGKSFQSHYHESMEEVFIIVSGKAEVVIHNKTEILERGDAVVISMRETHSMKNVSDTVVEYIAIGITREKGGRTIIVEGKN